MKKQILFYIGWDTIFLFMMFLNVFYEKRHKECYVRFNSDIILYVWISFAFLVIIGIWISLLMFIGNKFDLNKKSAILEFILVGIPALHLATCMALLFSLMKIINWASFPIPPFYFKMIAAKLPIQLGGILFGYELFILIVRMIGIRNAKTENEPNEILKEL